MIDPVGPPSESGSSLLSTLIALGITLAALSLSSMIYLNSTRVTHRLAAISHHSQIKMNLEQNYNCAATRADLAGDATPRQIRLLSTTATLIDNDTPLGSVILGSNVRAKLADCEETVDLCNISDSKIVLEVLEPSIKDILDPNDPQIEPSKPGSLWEPLYKSAPFECSPF